MSQANSYAFSFYFYLFFAVRHVLWAEMPIEATFS